MIVTTGNDIAGRTIKSYLGVVRGIVVRSPSIAQGILGGLKQFVGGNIESYASVCEKARQEAFDRMVSSLHRLRPGRLRQACPRRIQSPLYKDHPPLVAA